MIVVQKGKEPNSLLAFRKQHPDADYDDMPTNVLKDVRSQMWEEQGHLCAYCMKKIDDPHDVRVEHCKPRHPQDEIEHDKKATLEFKWMLGVCYGNSIEKGVKPEDTTCDVFNEKANRFANLLLERGVQKGDKVGILLMNCLLEKLSIKQMVAFTRMMRISIKMWQKH